MCPIAANQYFTVLEELATVEVNRRPSQNRFHPRASPLRGTLEMLGTERGELELCNLNIRFGLLSSNVWAISSLLFEHAKSNAVFPHQFSESEPLMRCVAEATILQTSA